MLSFEDYTFSLVGDPVRRYYKPFFLQIFLQISFEIENEKPELGSGDGFEEYGKYVTGYYEYSSIQLWCGRIGDGQGGGFDCPKSFKHYRQPYLSFGLNLQYK
jgi:hypothetical protein